LNEGTTGVDSCSYLESLGFVQIFLIDNIQIFIEKKAQNINFHELQPEVFDEDLFESF
jgi:hypothetical protein